MSLQNQEQCRKRPRTEAPDDRDEFPDEDFTAEEFDACLSQVTLETSAGVFFKVPAEVPTTTHTNFSLDGEVQLLRQRVARLSRELHGERLSKQDELKSQADAYKKQIHQLKTQLEFKEHEIASARAVPVKLSVGSTLPPDKVQVVDASNDARQFPVVALHEYWDLFAVNPEPNCGPTYLSVIRSYVSSLKASDKSVKVLPLDGVVLALRSLGALIESQMFNDTSLLKQLCTDATNKGRAFFDVIADVLGGNPSKSRVIAEALDVIEMVAAASSEAAELVVRHLQCDVLLRLVAGSFGERTVERALRLLRLALECDGDRLFVHSNEATCLWRAVADHFKRERAVSALCEAAILAQRGSEGARGDCACFHDLVCNLMECFRKGIVRYDPTTSRQAIVLLNCFCAVADAKPSHQLRVCRLVALCTDLPECEEAVRDVTGVWDFAMDDREIYLGCDSGRSSQGF